MKIKKIIRSKRKTIALQVCDDATLIIRAPARVTNNTIEKIIRKYSKWLENKRREIISRNKNFVEKKYVSGEGFLYLGKSYPLKIIKNSQTKHYLIFDNSCFYLRDRIDNSREEFIAWYKQAAKEKILPRVEWFAETTGYRYKKVKISNARKQWGSCSYLGNIYFSWRLIMSPLSVIDYVIVHELVHLTEKNHSKLFWDKVGSIMPDYKRQKNWLRKHGYLLTV